MLADLSDDDEHDLQGRVFYQRDDDRDAILRRLSNGPLSAVPKPVKSSHVVGSKILGFNADISSFERRWQEQLTRIQNDETSRDIIVPSSSSIALTPKVGVPPTPTKTPKKAFAQHRDSSFSQSSPNVKTSSSFHSKQTKQLLTSVRKQKKSTSVGRSSGSLAFKSHPRVTAPVKNDASSEEDVIDNTDDDDRNFTNTQTSIVPSQSVPGSAFKRKHACIEEETEDIDAIEDAGSALSTAEPAFIPHPTVPSISAPSRLSFSVTRPSPSSSIQISPVSVSKTGKYLRTGLAGRTNELIRSIQSDIHISKYQTEKNSTDSDVWAVVEIVECVSAGAGILTLCKPINTSNEGQVMDTSPLLHVCFSKELCRVVDIRPQQTLRLLTPRVELPLSLFSANGMPVFPTSYRWQRLQLAPKVYFCCHCDAVQAGAPGERL
eukprot:GILK01016730.1.p1 GENE.GILK01016730.1~~GILK01016730.1.p1  ORF type:complete len:434 (+),score=41.59 GILK01016730.1:39-1340(+)